MAYLIADSGSTKTSWVYVDGSTRQEFETLGINPVRDSEEEIEENLTLTLSKEEGILPLDFTSVNTPLAHRQGMGMSPSVVFFYGAGCIPPYSDVVRRVLERHFTGASIHVESDLLGAAHALCGHEEGIACILGTGSNSCLYDGKQIVENVSPLGWILGDEGSGAVLGRLLVGNVLKSQFSPALCQAFAEETGLSRADIINKVYRQPLPNRFLASLVPFLGRHRESEEIRHMLISEFRRFLHRNVAHYQRPDLPVSFVGGIAHSYREELEEALRLEGMRLGRIVQRPIDGMVDYLTNI
ncbi:MAG: ATPase [Bacteroidaceae bacterium]|nr:ATPase [Bacteroidaceae bacterium]